MIEWSARSCLSTPEREARAGLVCSSWRLEARGWCNVAETRPPCGRRRGGPRVVQRARSWTRGRTSSAAACACTWRSRRSARSEGSCTLTQTLLWLIDLLQWLIFGFWRDSKFSKLLTRVISEFNSPRTGIPIVTVNYKYNGWCLTGNRLGNNWGSCGSVSVTNLKRARMR